MLAQEVTARRLGAPPGERYGCLRDANGRRKRRMQGLTRAVPRLGPGNGLECSREVLESVLGVCAGRRSKGRRREVFVCVMFEYYVAASAIPRSNFRRDVRSEGLPMLAFDTTEKILEVARARNFPADSGPENPPPLRQVVLSAPIFVLLRAK